MNRLVILEKRLKLLKESFDAGVIDPEEYRRNKDKIEKEIEAINQPQVPKEKPEVQETPSSEVKEAKEETATHEETQPEQSPDVPFESTDNQEETTLAREDTLSTELGEGKPEFQEQTPEEEVSKIIDEATQESSMESPSTESDGLEKKTEDGESIELPTQEDREEEKNDDREEVAPIITPKPKKRGKEDHTLRTVLWIICAIIVLGLLVFFSINLGQMYPNETAHEKEEQKPTIACYQHADCAKNGLEAKCVNGGKSDAMCQYRNATMVELIIIGDGECSLCSSDRMKNVIKGWFPGVQVKNVAFSSSEGKALRTQHSIDMLPAYVLDSAIEDTLLFSDVKSALRASGDSYIVKDSASGASLFLTRNEIIGQIDVLVAPSDESSKRAILNLEEFSDSFGEEVDVIYHVVKDSNASKIAACAVTLAPQRATEYLLCDATSDEDCVATLGLSSTAIDSCVEDDSSSIIDANTKLQSSLGIQVPSFLINNRLRVGGVQAADTLREQFCGMNDATACSKELKKSLV
jgi:hypothetical protein